MHISFAYLQECDASCLKVLSWRQCCFLVGGADFLRSRGIICPCHAKEKREILSARGTATVVVNLREISAS